MPKLQIEQAHKLSIDEVNKRIDAFCGTLESKYGIESKRSSPTELSFKRTGASGTLKCHAEKVVIALDLSFALTPMKSKVEEKIRSELARVLGA